MTLIACYLDAQRVVQVSDMRLTLADGSVVDDNAVKAIVVFCRNAHFTLAYTGLAQVTGADAISQISGDDSLLGSMIRQGNVTVRNGLITVRTDTWLTSFLEAEKASAKTRYEIAAELQSFATISFQELRRVSQIPRERTALTIQLGGFEEGEPFNLVVSNVRDESRHLTAVNDRFFVSRIATEASRISGTRHILFEGAVPAIEGTVDGRVSATRKRIGRSNDLEAARKLATLVRGAARHPQHGHLIGQRCLATVLTPDGTYRAWTLPDGTGSLVHAPHVLTPKMSLYGVTVETTGDDPDVAFTPWLHGIE